MQTSDEPSAATMIRNKIRDSILCGDYAPRQRLVEVDLCERFGASRFAVRTALQELATQGLVELQRNSGARVRDVSLADAIEITNLRRLLEGHVAAEAAKRVSKENAAALRQIIRSMQAAVITGELVRYGQLNAELHGLLGEISGQRMAVQLLEQLRGLTVRHQFTLSLVPGRSSTSLPQHQAIVAAVIGKQPERAEAAMRSHLQSVIDAFRSLERAATPGLPTARL